MVAPASGPSLLRAIVFLPVAMALLVAAGFAGRGAQTFIQTSQTTAGTVTRLLAGGSHPEIGFTTRKGRHVTYPQGGLIGGYRVGQGVRVRYLPADPEGSACVDRWPAVWGTTLLLLVLGAGAGVSGAASAMEFSRR